MSLLSFPAESLGDFETSRDLDARLGALALRARTDPDIRNALYRLLDYKIERFVRRYRQRARQLAIYEYDDVVQAAFVVFCDLVERWPGDRSFLGYFFTRFPWRLARAIDVIERGTSTNQFVPVEEVEEPPPSPYPDDALALIEAGALLSTRDREVLELRAGYGMTTRDTARMLGLSPRTIHRRWARIIDELREAAGYESNGHSALTAHGVDGVIDEGSQSMVDHQKCGET